MDTDARPAASAPDPGREATVEVGLRFGWQAWLVLVLGLAAAGLLALGAQRTLERDADLHFRFDCEHIRGEVAERLDGHRVVLQGAAGLVEALPGPLTRRAWHEYTRRVQADNRFSGVQGLGYAVLVPPEGLAAHTAAIRAEGFPDYAVRPPGPRERYSAIIYLEPFAGRNLRAFGYDMLSEPVRRRALDLARDTGHASLSGRVVLVQETDRDVQAGFLMFVPLFKPGAPAGTLEERRAALSAWTYSPFRMNDLIGGMIGEWPARPGRDLRLEIYDGAPEPGRLLYDSGAPGGDWRPGAPVALDLSMHAISLQGEAWTLRFTPAAVVPLGRALGVFGLGVLAALLLTALVAAHLGALDGAGRLGRSQWLLARTERLGHLGSWSWQAATGTVLWSEGLYRLSGLNPGGGEPDLNGLVALHHPEDQAPFATLLAAAQERGAPFEVEVRLLRPGGEVRTCLARCRAEAGPDGRPTGLHGSHQDITERRRTEADLQDASSRLALYFDQTPLGAIEWDPRLRVRRWNASAARIFGYTEAEVLGRTGEFLIPEALRPMVAARLRRVQEGEDLDRGVNENLCRDGRVILCEWSDTRLRDASGRMLGVVSIVEDITARRRAEEDQERLRIQLAQSQKMESLGILAGGVAHDMNNVLGAILALASAHLPAQAEGGPLRAAFETIVGACNRGAQVVRSLLSFARQDPAESRAVDLNQLLRENARLLERTTLSKVRLGMELDPGLRPIQGDGSALAHAFMNLCVNAVDAMPEGGPLVLRTANAPGDEVTVMVEDGGSGMPPEVAARALEPFFTTKDPGRGTGLGLSMVYSTVTAHRGRMEIRSTPGVGTTVQAWFPACAAEAGAPAPEAAEPTPEAAEPGGAPSHTLSVLLVDDDELIRFSVQSLLEALGHGVSVAGSGEEALAAVEAGLRPDLVILDNNMPGLGGAATLPRLRALLPDLPVLLATGRADQRVLDLLAAHPGVVLLSKPFTLVDLRRLLEPFERS